MKDSAELLRAVVVELLAELLDETVPLGELHRLVDSARQTVSERARGIEEYEPAWPAVAATNAAALHLVELIASPYEPRRSRLDSDELDDEPEA